MGIYIGEIVATEERLAHIARHGFSLQDVRDLVQRPAVPLRAAWEVHPEHGERAVVLAEAAPGVRVLVALDPCPKSDGRSAETWAIRTAYTL